MRFTEEYEAYCSEFTDAPEIFHRFSAYFLVSSVLGRKAFLTLGDRRLFANLWLILVAPSSFYHKSTSLNIARRILDHVNEGFAFPNEFSKEKILETFQKQPEGAFFFDEAASLFEGIRREYNRGAEAMLTTLYGGGKYKRVTGIQEEKIITVEDPYINIIAASTIPWLVDTVSLSSMTGGFLPRFIFLPATERTKIFPFQPKANVFKMNALVSMLGDIASRCVGEMEFDEDARASHSAWYMNYVATHETKDKKVQPFLSRLADDYVFKLAIICACDRGEFPRITMAALTESRLAVELVAHRFQEVLADEMGTTTFQKNILRVTRIIKDSPEPVSLRQIYHKTRLSKFEMAQVIDTLIDSETIEKITVNPHTKPSHAFIIHGQESRI